MIIAIHPDDYTTSARPGPDASSPLWTQFLKQAGHHVRAVDVFRTDILDQLRGCDGFMWRHGHLPHHRQIARRLLPVIERQLGLEIYPDQKTCWHYDDKIAQYYLLKAAGLPTPDTWVWFDDAQAMHWAENAKFPFVLKLSSGTASRNVCLVRDLKEARRWIRGLFTHGLANIGEFRRPPLRAFAGRCRRSAAVLLKGRFSNRPWELHRGYILAQEFIAHNEYDTRIVVIGNRAFAKRRYNRPGDFRASGTTRVDTDPAKVDIRALQLVFLAARQLQTQSLAFDILRRHDENLISEISYTYPSRPQYDCPGHWEMIEDGLTWVEGHMWPEKAQIQDFLARLEQRRGIGRLACV